MYRIHEVKLRLGESMEKLPEKILKKIGRKDILIRDWQIVKESIDARDKGDVHFVLTLDEQHLAGLLGRFRGSKR